MENVNTNFAAPLPATQAVHPHVVKQFISIVTGIASVERLFLLQAGADTSVSCLTESPHTNGITLRQAQGDRLLKSLILNKTIMPESINMKIEMPPEFTAACEALHITPQKALQQYIDHLSVFVHFTTPDKAPHSIVSTIFKTFIDKRGFIPPPDTCRELHIRCIQQLLQLIHSKMNLRKKEQQYQRLIGEWYDGLIKTE